MSIFTGSCVALVTPFNDDGSINFDKFIEKVREDEINVAQNAVKYYGSTKKYTKAIKKNLDNFLKMVHWEL